MFTSLYPELLQLAGWLEGGLDSAIAEKSNIYLENHPEPSPAFQTRALVILHQLSDQFGIRVPRDPVALLERSEYFKFVTLVLYARLGELGKARKIEFAVYKE